MKYSTVLSLSIFFLIVIQGNQLTTFFFQKHTRNDLKIFDQNPCSKINAQSSQVFPMLIRNCWPKINENKELQEFLFPRYMVNNIGNVFNLYDIALHQNTSIQLDKQQQNIISSILHGNEQQRIQGLYLFCTYPTLIEQINFVSISSTTAFERKLLEHCQNGTFKELQQLFFEDGSPNSSPYLESFLAQ